MCIRINDLYFTVICIFIFTYGEENLTDVGEQQSSLSIATRCRLEHEEETGGNCSSTSCVTCVQEGLGNYELLNKGQKLILIVPYTIIFILAVTQNILIIAAIFKTKTLHNTQNLLVGNLAISDLLLIIFCVPFTLTMLLDKGKWNYGAFLCKVSEN